MWLPVQTTVYLSPLRVRKGVFLAAMHSIHSALPGISRPGPIYYSVQFTWMRCQNLAALPHLAGTCNFPPAVISQPLFKRSHKLLCCHNYRLTRPPPPKWKFIQLLFRIDQWLLWKCWTVPKPLRADFSVLLVCRHIASPPSTAGMHTSGVQL